MTQQQAAKINAQFGSLDPEKDYEKIAAVSRGIGQVLRSGMVPAIIVDIVLEAVAEWLNEHDIEGEIDLKWVLDHIYAHWTPRAGTEGDQQ